MTRSWTAYLAGAAFALSSVAAGAALAQTSSAVIQRDVAPTAPAPGERHEERRIIMRDDGGHHVDQAEHLRTMLQLKPGQEAALTTYLAAVKPERHMERIAEMSGHGDAKTTLQRLTDMENHLAQQTAQSHARIEATRKFYDQLEPSQKKVFDELPMLMMGPMGPMMNMGDMRVMVKMDGLPSMPPMPVPPIPPAPPRAPAPPRS